MVTIRDVHLAIAFTLAPKLLMHLSIKHSLSSTHYPEFSLGNIILFNNLKTINS